jgi:hypothetical protein
LLVFATCCVFRHFGTLESSFDWSVCIVAFVFIKFLVHPKKTKKKKKKKKKKKRELY